MGVLTAECYLELCVLCTATNSIDIQKNHKPCFTNKSKTVIQGLDGKLW